MSETVHRIHEDIIQSRRRADLDDAGDAVVVRRSNGAVAALQRIISVVSALLIGLLTLRLFMVLLGANPAHAFANAVYDLTNPFVNVFRGLFNISSDLGTAGHFEVETLIAIVVYSLLAWGIISLLDLARSDEV